jgi:hypothetical protein
MRERRLGIPELPSERILHDMEILHHNFVTNMKEMEHITRTISSLYASLENELEVSSKFEYNILRIACKWKNSIIIVRSLSRGSYYLIWWWHLVNE